MSAVLVLAAGVAFIYFGHCWYISKLLQDGQGIGVEQVLNENIETTQTAEQTHEKFITALKNKNINQAVECCFQEKDWAAQKQLIRAVSERGQLDLMIADLDKIYTDFVGDTKATYVYSGTSNGQKIVNFMTFIKNSQGVWLIESY